ncbi:antibiotic biosynthesis monooxygenase family protein [Sorangium sp. So ce1182]|uniref:antibiotic biosynthesis monooxygenase family protein n=1 Tax=Sorangium sp. So ce1182 TaxID=3133334 RepID=UPI003F61B331
MFSVLFEVQPRADRWDAYLDNARMLRPELEQVEGFVENIRYKSLGREGWILSVSSWRDEKSVVRWRTRMRHHEVQEKGRGELLLDYHLRVGQYTFDTQLPEGYTLEEQRLDETEVGEGKAARLITARRPDDWRGGESPAEHASFLGNDARADGLVAWDVYESVFAPGELLLMQVWRDRVALERSTGWSARATHRERRVRVIRDYSMVDRREAPQYFPEVRRV